MPTQLSGCLWALGPGGGSVWWGQGWRKDLGPLSSMAEERRSEQGQLPHCRGYWKGVQEVHWGLWLPPSRCPSPGPRLALDGSVAEGTTQGSVLTPWSPVLCSGVGAGSIAVGGRGRKRRAPRLLPAPPPTLPVCPFQMQPTDLQPCPFVHEMQMGPQSFFLPVKETDKPPCPLGVSSPEEGPAGIRGWSKVCDWGLNCEPGSSWTLKSVCDRGLQDSHGKHPIRSQGAWT